MEKERKIKRKQSYSFEWIEYEDGYCTMKRINKGFTAFELQGYLTFIQSEINEQIKGVIKPDFVERIVDLNDPES